MNPADDDLLVTRSRHVGEPMRAAEIRELAHVDESPPHRLRWSDPDLESLLFPNPDVFVKHFSSYDHPQAEVGS